MIFDDLMRDGQSQPGPLRFRGEEGLEDAIHSVFQTLQVPLEGERRKDRSPMCVYLDFPLIDISACKLKLSQQFYKTKNIDDFQCVGKAIYRFTRLTI
jgi:hypothetical protein